MRTADGGVRFARRESIRITKASTLLLKRTRQRNRKNRGSKGRRHCCARCAEENPNRAASWSDVHGLSYQEDDEFAKSLLCWKCGNVGYWGNVG
jgi:hypothetical protein